MGATLSFPLWGELEGGKSYSHLAMENPHPRHPSTIPCGTLRVMRYLSRLQIRFASKIIIPDLDAIEA